jgi:hypothetical protein
MKKRYYIVIFALLTASITHNCPTCVGRMTADSPPFFSETQETTPTQSKSQEKKLSWREEIIKQQQQKKTWQKEHSTNEK